MIKNIKKWWYYYKPEVINRCWLDKYNEYLLVLDYVNRKSVEHLIENLKELRKNTWDKKRVDDLIEYINNRLFDKGQ